MKTHQNRLSWIFTGLEGKLMDKSKSILSVFLIGVSVLLSAQTMACPCPPCPGCQRQTGSYPNCNCVDDDSNCTGCESCSGGFCIDDNSKCGDCQSCVGGECVSCSSLGFECCGGVCILPCRSSDCESCNPSTQRCESDCTGCETCSYLEICQDDNSKCPGECSECFMGSCRDNSSLCSGECESCSGGDCIDDDSLCTGECDECSGGDCIDDNSLCTGECHNGCSGGDCVDDDNLCTGECHDGCSDGDCIDNGSLCTGECHLGCSAGDCVDYDLFCSGECHNGCSDGDCVDDNSLCTGECHNGCSGGSCVDDDSLCTGPCNDGCSEGDCVFACTTPPDLYCRASDDTCIECTPDAGGDCTVTAEELGYDPENCVSNMAGAGQCFDGGEWALAWQTSTDTNATGSGAEDSSGCADVRHISCKTILVTIDPRGHIFDCVLDLESESTENYGQHKVCP